jgi:tRNA threonylcarbamoyl adenosine modification protein (Sua5/YciO/YrdC/YwlC family)
MPEIINLKDIKKRNIVKRIKQGEIFIYPTDTIYGIGCNALKPASVEIIKKIKKRSEKPFSIIAPSKDWIYKNLKVNNKSYIKKLPGPFTFILELKKRATARNVNPGYKTLGVRIPNHPFSNIIKSANVPFITTSVNISGKTSIRSIKQIPRSIKKHVDIIIDDGYLPNYPSTIIDLTQTPPKIITRR